MSDIIVNRTGFITAPAFGQVGAEMLSFLYFITELVQLLQKFCLVHFTVRCDFPSQKNNGFLPVITGLSFFTSCHNM